MTDARIVFTTAGSKEEARRIAHERHVVGVGTDEQGRTAHGDGTHRPYSFHRRSTFAAVSGSDRTISGQPLSRV